MRNPAPGMTRSSTAQAKACTDPVVGAILSGWRYDISSIPADMRTDYETHLAECAHCRHRQHAARTMDVLLITVSTLSIVAFLLAAAVMHRLEALTHIGGSLTLHLRQEAITISLQAVAFAGLLISLVLWILVAISTPLPGLVMGLTRHIPPDIRQRFTRRHA